MEARKLKKREYDKAKELYTEVFSTDSQGFIDYYFTEKTKDNDIYGLFDENQLVSMIHLNPYELVIAGSKGPIHYIVAVATKKEYRSRGYMGILLKKIMNDLRKQGEVMTYLMPVAEAIYAPYDFYTVYEKHWDYYQDETQFERGASISKLSVTDIDELVEIKNAALASQCQIYIYRNRIYYERLIKEYAADGGKLLLESVDEKPKRVHLDVANPELIDSKFMVRILNVEKLLSHVTATGSLSLYFCLTDEYVEENEGIYILTTTKDYALQVSRNNQEETGEILTIAALTGFLFGKIKANELHLQNGVSITKGMEEELLKIIPFSRIRFDEVV